MYLANFFIWQREVVQKGGTEISVSLLNPPPQQKDIEDEENYIQYYIILKLISYIIYFFSL